jgi:hypothetical protein
MTSRRHAARKFSKKVRFVTLPGRAQVRLCGRFRRLAAIGKKRPVIVAAIVREMAAFLWAIGQHIAPAC